MSNTFNKEEWVQEQEEKKKELTEKISAIAEGWEVSPTDMVDFVRFKARFYQYSSRNTMLIYNQNPGALFCASYKGFRDLGYYVKRGETGMKILVPVITTLFRESPDSEWKRLSDASEKEKQNIQREKYEIQKVRRFKIGTVFDVSQTNCPSEDYPKLFTAGYPSEQHRQAFEGLAAFSKEELGCPVRIENFRSVTKRGYYDPIGQQIVINERLNDTEKLSTMSHELGHAILHNLEMAEKNTEKTTAQKELEADTFSLMLQERMGIELTETRRSHLANAYKAFFSEQDKGEKVSAENIVNNIFEMYDANMEKIESYINAGINAVSLPSQSEDKRNSQTPLEDQEMSLKLTDDYRRQVQANFEHEVENNIPENDRMASQNTLYVNFFAGPGAGKTTAAWAIAAELKKAGIEAEYVAEYAKELVWEGNNKLLDGSEESQRILFEEQNRRLARLQGKVPVVVTDSPILLNCIYGDTSDEYKNVVREKFFSYNNFNVFVERGKGFVQSGRIHSLEQSVTIDTQIKQMLDGLGIKYGKYNHDTLGIITQNIIHRINYLQEHPEQATNKSRGIIDGGPKERHPFYDLDEIKAVPIEEICESLGIEVKHHGGSVWCAVRNEKTPSVKIYVDTNTFCDFGNGNLGGSSIDFVKYAEEIRDNQTAIYRIAELFGIRPINDYDFSHNCELTDAQYRRIGIQADLATKNFDFNVEKYGIDRTKQFAEKYRMTVQELRVKYPNVYANVLKKKAIPEIHAQRQEYYQTLHIQDRVYREAGLDLSVQDTLPKEIIDAQKELIAAEKAMIEAIKGTDVKFSARGSYEPRKAITDMRSGKLQFEIGSVGHVNMKQISKNLTYFKMPEDDYLNKKDQLNEIPHSAFVGGNMVNIAYDKSDDDQIRRILNAAPPKATI